MPAALGFIRHDQLAPKALGQWLSLDELRKRGEIPSERRKRTWGSGRYILKKTACHLLGLKGPDDLTITTAVLEYPILKAPFSEVPELTLSHTDTHAVALAGEAGHACGVDLETIDPKRQAVFRKVLTSMEEAHQKALHVDSLTNAVIHWSLREALSKAVRCGFTVPFQILEVSRPRIVAPDTAHCHFSNFGQFAGQVWWNGPHVFAMVFPKKGTPMGLHNLWEELHATGCFP